MAENIIGTQIKEYLMEMQEEITVTLEHFKQHGVTIDEEFEKYLMETSKDW